MTPEEFKIKIRDCKCNTCLSVISLMSEAGAKLRFGPNQAGRLCEIAVVAASGKNGLYKDEVVQARRDYAEHLGIQLSGSIQNSDKPIHINHAIKNSNHNPKAREPINLGLADAKLEDNRFYITWKKTGTSDDIASDIAEIQNDEAIEWTTKEALVNARLGQGKFRSDLMQIWNNSCAVTGCTVSKVLKASHIKPWRDSTNKQRLDPNNGLLLTANLDALFDSGLISFKVSGEMIVSEQLSTKERKFLGIPQSLRAKPNPAQSKYLAHHRKKHNLDI